jgi:uncharacterized membrane protein YccC
MLKQSAQVLAEAVRESLFSASREAVINAAQMAVSITLAVLLAKLAHKNAPYWAGISAMMVVMPSLPDILKKGAMRLAGTALGAGLGVAVHFLTLHSELLFFCALFISITVPLIVMQKSQFPYTWLIGGITCDIVMLGGLALPQETFAIARERMFEITIGVITTVVFYSAFTYAGRSRHVAAVNTTSDAPRAPAPSHALAGGPVTAAVAGGLAGCIAVWLWRRIGFTGIEQSVTSVWVLSFCGPVYDTWYKAVQRAGGCIAGGLAAALLLHVPNSLGVFLLLMLIVSFVFCVIQNGPQDGRYFGLQGVFAFLIVYASSEGSHAAIDRFYSILLGLVLVLLTSWSLAYVASRIRVRKVQ